MLEVPWTESKALTKNPSIATIHDRKTNDEPSAKKADRTYTRLYNQSNYWGKYRLWGTSWGILPMLGYKGYKNVSLKRHSVRTPHKKMNLKTTLLSVKLIFISTKKVMLYVQYEQGHRVCTLETWERHKKGKFKSQIWSGWFSHKTGPEQKSIKERIVQFNYPFQNNESG